MSTSHNQAFGRVFTSRPEDNSSFDDDDNDFQPRRPSSQPSQPQHQSRPSSIENGEADFEEDYGRSKASVQDDEESTLVRLNRLGDGPLGVQLSPESAQVIEAERNRPGSRIYGASNERITELAVEARVGFDPRVEVKTRKRSRGISEGPKPISLNAKISAKAHRALFKLKAENGESKKAAVAKGLVALGIKGLNPKDLEPSRMG